MTKSHIFEGTSRALAIFAAAALGACSPDNSSPPGVGYGGSAGASGATGGASGAGGSGLIGGSSNGGTGISIDSGAGSGGTSGGGGDGGPTRDPVLIDQCGTMNPLGLVPADLQRLLAGGSATGMRWLYPYDGTVFPRGLKGPLLMWEGPTASAVYVHIRSTLFEYKGCLAPTAPGQLQLPLDVWRTAEAQTQGANDPYTVEITTMSGTTVTGPISEKVVIAQANLKGSIYYGTYNSLLAGGFGGGAVFRLPPGGDAQFFLRQNTCTGCHSLSGNGARLLASEALGTNGSAYSIAPNTAPNPQPARAAVAASFAGLSPDGKVYVGTAALNGVGPRNGGPVQVPSNAALYETDTGTVINGTGIPAGAMMPTFSPDGTLLVFADYAIQNGHGLALMRYDAAQRKASDYKQIYANAQVYAGWPFVLPDNRAVLFASGVVADFTGSGAGVLPGVAGPTSDLQIIDLATGKATILAQAMGFRTPQDAASSRTYLPFGAAELHQHYYPTVSPVAAGGFFWIFFDTVRNYGNMGLKRQLWGAALAISAEGKYDADPSRPAFYLPGQELGTANHRAFTALDPCRQDGMSCESGVDCCTGFCTDGKCGPKKEPRCSKLNEACQTGADCCSPSHRCIAGFCAQIVQ
jgi:hypothetical protein